MLSDDLVASNRLRRAGLEVRFDPACVLTSPVDFDWSGMFDFVRRQYRITRHYAFRWWLLALAAATVGNLAWIASLGLLACTMFARAVDRVAAGGRAWQCFTAWGSTAAGPCRAWPASTRRRICRELRGVRRWHIWASPAVAFVQWLGLIASAFGNRVKWRAIDYRLGADGRVLSQRILAAPEDAAVEGPNRRRSQGLFNANLTVSHRIS